MAQKKKKDKHRKKHQQHMKKKTITTGLSFGKIVVIIFSIVMVFTLVFGSLAAMF